MASSGGSPAADLAPWRLGVSPSDASPGNVRAGRRAEGLDRPPAPRLSDGLKPCCVSHRPKISETVFAPNFRVIPLGANAGWYQTIDRASIRSVPLAGDLPERG